MLNRFDVKSSNELKAHNATCCDALARFLLDLSSSTTTRTRTMSDDRVDVDRILSTPAESFTASYNQRDLILYAAGIGESDLQFTYEYNDKFAAFPLCTSSMSARLLSLSYARLCVLFD